jgi:phosphatidylserine decarboxylase
MSMIDSIRRQISPVHPEGYVFIAGFAVTTLVLAWVAQPLGWIGAVLTGWCVYFFRDPVRQTPVDGNIVVSPADGIVSSIGFFRPPPELGLGTDPMQRISVFMSVFDCHVNRMPVAGRVTRIAYKAGKFFNADLDKASEDNERNSLIVDGDRGRFGVVQIAGLVARRIVCFTKQGESLPAGERFGLIRFGSRVDVYFPIGARPLVGLGSKTIAGETVIADFSGESAARVFRSV